ncbi:MAG: ferrous iron transport protein A [Clostridia bacterium]|nr:ferrous iron transport protein A [Clostridia bacterium]MBQ7727246.1 ferrous iron transport protein A [Clostridia bacterium]
MLPLTLAEEGKEYTIRKVSGSPEVKQHLYDMGFVIGGTVTIVTSNSGNVIVNVKNVRIAIGKEMAQKVMI